MSIKLIAVDMDGTLLQDDHDSVLPADVQALNDATDQGVVFVPATGRMAHWLPPMVQQLNWRYCIGSNGAAIYDREQDRMIAGNHLTTSQVLAVIEVLQDMDLFFELYANGNSYTEGRYVEQYTRYNIPDEWLPRLRQKVTLVDDLSTFGGSGTPIEKIYISNVPPALYQPLQDRLSTLDVALVNSGGDYNLDVNCKTASKGAALQQLCALLGIEMADVMAIGDNFNDLTMLQMAGVGVAMGNADQAVQAVADYVTDTNHKAGVSKAIHTYHR